jgi:hypothetical protein
MAIAREIKAFLKGGNDQADSAFTDDAGYGIDERKRIECRGRHGMRCRGPRRMKRCSKLVGIHNIDAAAVLAKRLHKANRNWEASAGNEYSCLLSHYPALCTLRGAIYLG